MDAVEFNRRRIHGILSSKSLLESLDSLTLNKLAMPYQTGNKKKVETEKSIIYKVESKNNSYVSVPNSLKISSIGKMKKKNNTIYS